MNKTNSSLIPHPSSFILPPMLIFWFVVVFVFGAAVGSFLNVCIYRIPYEKSLLWPGSHCGSCYQPIRLWDNVPLLSYWLLGGKCRTCGAKFSIRYFFVELGTALAFIGLFYAEIVGNYMHIPYLAQEHAAILDGNIPLRAWALFVYHAILICFLIVTSLSDIDHLEVPLSVTVTGTIVGLIGGTLLPWPFPNAAAVIPALGPISAGVFHWPVWDPRELPNWLQPGNLAIRPGDLAGRAHSRARWCCGSIRLIFGLGRGIEGMGLGDADLMMMAGSFLGWQPVLVAFVAGVFPGLLLGLVQLLRKGDHPLPFVPPLAIGVVLSLFFWQQLGEPLRLLFFDGVMLGVLAVFGAVALFVIAFALRLIRGKGSSEAEA